MRVFTGITFFVAALGLGAMWLAWSGQTAAPQTPKSSISQASEARGAIDVIAGLPEDLDMIIVVDRAAELRGSPVGAAVLRFLDDAGTLSDVTKAWTELAAQLGWTETETFDRLLGKRVVLASRATGEADRRWALLSDVSAETDRRLRERLKVSPRGISQGHQILAVENGEFELVTHRLSQGKPGLSKQIAQADNDRFTLLFGPTGRGELLDELLSTLAKGGAVSPMRQRESFEIAKAQGRADVLVMTSTAARGAQQEPWGDFVVLSASRQGEHGELPANAWRASVLVRDRAQQAQLRAMSATDSAAFNALREGSLLAVIQNAPLPSSMGFGLAGASILSAFPIPQDAKAMFTPRQAVAVRVVGRDERMSASVAMHSNSPARAARLLDSAVARGVEVFEQRMTQSGPSPAITTAATDYAGIAPEAVRVVPLPASGASPMNLLTARPLVLSWVYATRPGVNGPYNSEHPACGVEQLAAPAVLAPKLDDGSEGWMVINASQEPSISMSCDPVVAAREAVVAGAAYEHASPQPWSGCGPSAAEIVRNDANALTTRTSGELERWFLLAHMRPAALEQRLPSVFPDFKGARSLMRRFESFELQIKATEAGDLSGQVRLRFVGGQP